MSYDEILVLVCGALWLIHAAQIVRLPVRRTWPLHVIIVAALGGTAGAYVLLPVGAGAVAAGLVAVFLVAPALAARGASHALRWGKIGRARLLANLAWLCRPLSAQRRFRRSIEFAWRLSRGQELDLDQAIEQLGPLSEVERAANRVALLSWTNDFVAMAREIHAPAVRAFAGVTGMAAIVTTVIGETAGETELIEHYRMMCRGTLLTRRHIDGTWMLLCTAAYLGDADRVRQEVALLTRDVPPERIAFLVATAEQRAGRPEAAERSVEQALARRRLLVSARRRLEYRVTHPLAPAIDSPARAETIADVARRLHARRALAQLGFGGRRAAPLSWTVALTIAIVFAWQLTQASDQEVFRAWGLIAPFSRSPDAYRLLSYAWIHLDAGHLIINLLGLVIFGRFVERHFSWWRYGIIYVGGALSGGAAFLGWTSSLGVAIGASGAVLALFGATAMRIAGDRELRATRQGKRELSVLVVVAGIQLVVDAVWAQSSGSAHAGGLVAGAVLAALLMATSRRAQPPT
ncbi:MAG: rhomboid family intramembrane serine protease [Deltaproteobacteria bacterium]|nr:rhomboid family intramembrane serine protease [Deltaproteobacteria bacterium]